MKKQFFDTMLDIMRKNPKVFLIFIDLGYPRVEEFLKEFPDRAFTTGASEQTAMDMAVGIAYSGFIPVVYSITPFLLYRPFETIRTLINHEKLNVKLVGAGRGSDYSHEDGYSHDASDDRYVFEKLLSNFGRMWPTNTDQVKECVEYLVNSDGPQYLNLRR